METEPSRADLPVDLAGRIDQEVSGLLEDLVRARRHLHRHPELSWKERETMDFLARELTGYGLKPVTGIAGTGIIVDIEGASAGPLTAYRADMDAIALVDGKSVEYASSNPGVMHACGHDLHMAVALGVAAIANRLRDRLRGGLRIFFQPAEEMVPAGSAAMIEAGVMDGVSAVYAIHSEPALPTGHVGLRYGTVTASADMFDLLIKGRSGHSSRPYLAIDAILIATKVVEAIYQLATQRIDPLESAVINVGTITGGDAANIICGHVRITGAIRCFDAALRRRLHEWLDELAGGIVKGMRGEYELSIRSGAPPLVNTHRLVDLVLEAAADVVDPSAIDVIDQPSMGGEDFSFYGEHADAALIRAGTGTAGPRVELHNELFDAGDDTLEPILRIVLRALFLRNSID